MAVWQKVGLSVAALYCLLLLALFLLQRHWIYPAPNGPASLPPGFTEVEYVTSDGLQLVGAWRSAENTKPVVVFFHGNADDWSGAALATQSLADAGYSVLLPEYRGYSGNPGSPDEKGLYKDGRAALSWLSRQGSSGDNVVLIGNSLGSGVAVQLASETQPQALILVSPYSSMVGLVAEILPWIPVRLLLTERYENDRKLPSIDVPTLIVHGSEDSLIPLSHGQRLAAVGRQTELRTFTDAGHELVYRPDAQAAQLDWLDVSIGK